MLYGFGLFCGGFGGGLLGAGGVGDEADDGGGVAGDGAFADAVFGGVGIPAELPAGLELLPLLLPVTTGLPDGGVAGGVGSNGFVVRGKLGAVGGLTVPVLIVPVLIVPVEAGDLILLSEIGSALGGLIGSRCGALV